MKNNKFKIGLLLLVTAVLFTGCIKEPKDSTGEDSAVNPYDAKKEELYNKLKGQWEDINNDSTARICWYSRFNDSNCDDYKPVYTFSENKITVAADKDGKYETLVQQYSDKLLNHIYFPEENSFDKSCYIPEHVPGGVFCQLYLKSFNNYGYIDDERGTFYIDYSDIDNGKIVYYNMFSEGDESFELRKIADANGGAGGSGAGGSGSGNASAIQGTWNYRVNNNNATVQFNNGTLTYNPPYGQAVTGTYSVSGSKITITVSASNTSAVFNYSVNNNSLTISKSNQNNTNETMVFFQMFSSSADSVTFTK